MSVRLRLGVTFAVVIGLLIVPVWYARAGLNDLEEMAVEGRRHHAAATMALGAFRAAMADFDRHQRAHVATLEPRLVPAVEAALQDLRDQIDRFEAAGYGQETRALPADLDSLVALSEQIGSLVADSQVDAATETFQEATRLQEAMAAELERIAVAIHEASRRDFDRAEEMSATAATTTIGATLAAALLAVIVSLWTTGALTTPLRKVSEAAARVEEGTLEAPPDLPYDRSDEIGDLSRSFRAMTNRLGELDRLKAEFMSVASHELKTPISVVRAYAEVIDHQLGDRFTDQQRAALDAIIDQTDVMVRLLNRLLNIGRLEAGTYRLEVETVRVEALIDQLARSFDVLARKEDVRFRTRIDETSPETIEVDSYLLQNEVLGNLVSNALRYTPAGGEIRVTVWREDSTVVFEVSDTGPGVPEEKRPYIFEKYYEGGRTRFMGAGLGLAVAREVTAAHGGRITLEPADGEGATFRVYLPEAPPSGSDGAA